jgi:hypothetical protein
VTRWQNGGVARDGKGSDVDGIPSRVQRSLWHCERGDDGSSVYLEHDDGAVDGHLSHYRTAQHRHRIADWNGDAGAGDDGVRCSGRRARRAQQRL